MTANVTGQAIGQGFRREFDRSVAVPELTGQKASEVLDGLMVLIRIAAQARSDVKVPGAVLDLIEHLNAVASNGNRRVDLETMISMGKFISTIEAGKRANRSGRRIRQLCNAGELEHVVIGGRYYIDTDSLQTFLQNRTRHDQKAA